MKTYIQLFYSLFLTLVAVFHIWLLAYFHLVKYPTSKYQFNTEEQKYNDLLSSKSELLESAWVNELILEYKAKTNALKLFMNNRKNVFSFSNNEKYLFLPDFADYIFPILTKHLHNDVTVEWISVSSSADIIIPIFSSSYTNLIVQYSVFKNAFANEQYSIISDISLNSINRDHIEIVEKNQDWKFINIKNVVHKAVIIWKINPLYFSSKTYTEEAVTQFEDINVTNKQDRLSIIKTVGNIFNVIKYNIIGKYKLHIND